MIQKKKWSDVIDWVYDNSHVSNWLVRHIDELVESHKLSQTEAHQILDVWKAMMSIFGIKVELIDEDFEMSKDYDLSPWKELPIFISSFKPIGSHNYFSKIIFDFNRYMDGYAMLLTNDGFAKTFVRSATGVVDTKANAKTKDYYSETPQNVGSGDEEVDELEYLSNASKNFVDSTGKTTATDSVTETTQAWQEKRKNYEMVYFKDICSYIIRIPYRMYDYYALDEYPALYSMKELYESIKTVYDIYAR